MWDRVAAIAASIAALASIVSAWWAWSSSDIAWRALQSSTVYQIQKDSIDIAKDYKDKKVGPGTMIAKLYSIYYQREKGVIDDGLWPMLNYEYCLMMQRDTAVQDFWDKADKTFYGPAFTKYVSGMRGGQKCV